MIAEIENKISSTGSNLSDRLEDKLTGDVFGSLRYLPAEMGLRHALSQARFDSQEAQDGWLACLDALRGYDIDYSFWPRHREGEIDLLLELPNAMIGIEVKYFSYLSSEDENIEEVFDPAVSQNQLVKYAQMMQRVGGHKTKYLVFLAPLTTVTQVETVMKKRGSISSEVSLGYLSWQEILESLQRVNLESLETGPRLILEDIMNLLVKKHFVRFRGFDAGLDTSGLSEAVYQFHQSQRNSLRILWPNQYIREEDTYLYNR